MAKDNYKIYMHKNKTNGKVYIGQTKQSVKHRWQNGNGYVGSPYFYNAIQKYGWDNFEHIVLHEGLTKNEADNLEMELISTYKSYLSEYGYNISHGGAGLTGATKYLNIYKYDMDGYFIKHYIDINEIIIENPTYSASCIRYCYDEKIQSSYGFQWKSYYQERIAALPSFEQRVSEQKRKEAHKYTLGGLYICSYQSFKQAAIDNDLEETSIGKCCNGKLKSYAGYQWKSYYAEKIPSIECFICYYDLDGNLLDCFSSTKIAENVTGINVSSIVNCYQGRYDLGGDYVWIKYNSQEEIKEKINIKLKNTILIQLIDENDNVIKTFKSAKKAAKELGFKDPGGIIKVCKGLQEKTHGYRFRYKF